MRAGLGRAGNSVINIWGLPPQDRKQSRVRALSTSVSIFLLIYSSCCIIIIINRPCLKDAIDVVFHTSTVTSGTRTHLRNIWLPTCHALRFIKSILLTDRLNVTNGMRSLCTMEVQNALSIDSVSFITSPLSDSFYSTFSLP